ncbi:hypothetical protein [Klebsiella variicola]|uniref:hypothetical protein n=1 Tax=Klebsiella variicola TaxID=244366 RepID=UPI001CCBE707|nr:hypothetical protein [Klebsiella variicola]MBZ7295985.1 hypothetical protein [Klebsiella variicola]
MSKRYNEAELLSVTDQQFMDFLDPLVQQHAKGLFCNSCGNNSFTSPSLIRATLTSNSSAAIDYYTLSCIKCGEVKLFNAQLIAASIIK